MGSRISAIIEATKYEMPPAMIATSQGLATERYLPMHDDSIIEIPLTQGKVALISAEDYPLISAHNWYALKRMGGKTFYAATMPPRNHYRRGSTVFMHRLILGAKRGQTVDHINSDGLDNRRCNLRFATPLQNMWNLRRPETNTSGYKGVRERPQGRWQARIKLPDRHTHIGSYDSAEEAARAYDAMARHHFGEFARLNFPDETPLPIGEIATGKRREKSSQFRGVAKSGSNKWRVFFRGKQIGLYVSEEEAARAYDAAAREAWGDKAKLNFPEEGGAS